MCRFKSEKGASTTEYALALVCLLVVCLLAAQALMQRSEERFDISTKVAEGMVPCSNAGLLDQDSLECK